jgi:hypothetical protein
MNIDTLLQETFDAHEELAPDPHDVLAAVHQRITHRRSGLTQPVAIAASVVVVAATATGAAVTLNRHGNQPAQPAASRSHIATAARPSAPGIAPLTMPYDLGWLPAGSVNYLAHRINVGAVSPTSPPSFDGEYLLTVTTASATIDIDVQQMPGDLTGVRFKSGPGVPVTIDGRDGIESRNSGGPGGYEVYFRDARGGVMYVNAGPHTVSSVSATELTTIGRHVAADVQFPGRTRVRPSFGVSHLPAGLRVRGFDVESGRSDLPTSTGPSGPTTSYDVGTSTGLESVVQIGTNSAAPPSGTPGRSVQGHPTRYTDDRGYRTLRVLDAVHGQAVAIAGRLPLSELYKIADGLVLPR